MKYRSLFLLFLVLIMACAAASQTPLITNAELDKYRRDRLRAERDYEKNYEKMGFASPAERDRRIAESRAETEQLSARLREERLERERLEAYREAQLASTVYSESQYAEPEIQSGTPVYFWSTGGRHRSGNRFLRAKHSRHFEKVRRGQTLLPIPRRPRERSRNLTSPRRRY